MDIIDNLLATGKHSYQEEDNYFFTAQLGSYRSTIQHDVEDNTWCAMCNGHWFDSMEDVIREEVNAALRLHVADITSIPFFCYDDEGDKVELRPHFRETIEHVFMRTAFVVCANAEDARLFEQLLEAFDYGKVEHEPDTPDNRARVYYWREGRGCWAEADSPMAEFICKQHYRSKNK